MSENAATAEQKMPMPKHGQVCWTEIATSNVENCKTFYAQLFGWNLKKSEAAGDDMEYYEFSNEADVCPSGGLYQMGKEYGDAPPHWMSYVSVDDVDEAASKVWELGGKVCVPPTDIPNVGRFCVVNDPTGATFSMITLKAWDGVS
ncbi:MAG TPA: VOC family protein [Pyrinomonadaceae bacterium]|jgi:hypothetical protein